MNSNLPWLTANRNRFPYRKLSHVGTLKARIGWQNLRTEEFTNEGPHCITGTDFKSRAINWDSTYHVTSERFAIDTNIQVKNGDLLVTKDGTIGKVAIVKGLKDKATLNSGVFVVRSKGDGFDSSFLGWVIDSKVFSDFVAFHYAGSTINHLYQNVFETFRFPFPPLETQRTIAEFLDRETARIDQLIQKKQRLGQLLEEKRSYIVRNALKPGLEDVFWNSDKRSIDFKFRDDDWSVACVKNVSSFMTSGSRGWSEFLNDDGEIFLQSGNIGRNLEVNFSDASRVYPQVGAEAVRTSVQKSDTLVCITGGRTGAVGFISNLPERSYINQHICLIRPESQKIEPKLLAMLLWSEIGQVQFDLFQYGLKQGLSFSEVGNTKIPLPPRAKHECILRRITESHQKATELFEMIRESITRLREFRSALITAAVTGQIDVDEWSRRGGTDAKLDAIAQEMEARA